MRDGTNKILRILKREADFKLKTILAPKYICYLSPNKIDNLYSQITDIELNSIQKKTLLNLEGKAELGATSIINKLINAKLPFGMTKEREFLLEGSYNHIQKLSQIINYYYKHGFIKDLSKAIENRENDPNAILYYFKGLFTCDYWNQNASKYIEEEEKQESLYSDVRNGFEIISRMVFLTTSIKEKEIVLSCSLRNFSNMVASRVIKGDEPSKDDKFEIEPHSGNYEFFSGMVPASFEAIVILNGQKGNTLYGSPIALINSFSPDLSI